VQKAVWGKVKLHFSSYKKGGHTGRKRNRGVQNGGAPGLFPAMLCVFPCDRERDASEVELLRPPVAFKEV
jgi:hypothetical protein